MTCQQRVRGAAFTSVQRNGVVMAEVRRGLGQCQGNDFLFEGANARIEHLKLL